MAVDRGRVAVFAAEDVVKRHIGALGLDVPQRDVDAADGIVQHRAVAPVAVDHHQAEQFLDAASVAAKQQRLEVLLDRRGHGMVALREGSAAKAV